MNSIAWRAMPFGPRLIHLWRVCLPAALCLTGGALTVMAGSGLKGEYYAGEFAELRLTRTDSNINFLWDSGSPDPALAPDQFSVRWTGQVIPRYTQTYTFHTISDDGVRLWVNGTLLIDNWTDHPPTEDSRTIPLIAGQACSIILEYYENAGGATIQLLWSSPSQTREVIPQSQLFPEPAAGLVGEYHNDQEFTERRLIRTDATLDFSWGTGSPDPEIEPDTFSVRWTGQIVPLYSESYTFHTVSDDGVRLWIGGRLVIDNWSDHPPTEDSGSISLLAGHPYNITLEFYENGGGATLQLFWSSPRQPREILPQSQLFSDAGVLSGRPLPPVVRSTRYDGTYASIVHFDHQPWMNSETVSLTVEAWIYANGLSGRQALVARNHLTSLFFGLENNRLRFHRSGGFSAESTATVPQRRWTHVAASYDGLNVRFYINGDSAGEQRLDHAGNNSMSGLSLGGQRENAASGGGWAFNGYLDEVRLWSVARSRDEINATMNQEVRTGAGLLAAFGFGGDRNDVTGQRGVSAAGPVADRLSGFGLLPARLCIPWTHNLLSLDGRVDQFEEYCGAETMVLRSTSSAADDLPVSWDRPAFLIVSSNSTTHHLFVGLPDLPQGSGNRFPTVQLMADVDPLDGSGLAPGDWECRLEQSGLQGGRIYGVNPPVFREPQWLSWAQGESNWEAASAVDAEFVQSYEFRVHAEHLNYFTNSIGLLARYHDYDSRGFQLVAPRGGIPENSSTYASAGWCGRSEIPLSTVTISGSVSNVAGSAGVAGLSVWLTHTPSDALSSDGVVVAGTVTDAQGRFRFSDVSVPSARHLRVTYVPPANVAYLDPVIGPGAGTLVPAVIRPTWVSYAPCPEECTYAAVDFRIRIFGPVEITEAPASVPGVVVIRTNPFMATRPSVITVRGSNFRAGMKLYFKGSGCAVDPPDLCGSDFVEATIVHVADDGGSLTAEVPADLNGVAYAPGSFQMVVQNPSFGTTGGSRWNYGPSVLVTPPLWAELHGFAFENRDDHPSVEEFEDSFGDSIFTYVPFPPFKIRDPYYGLWAAVYFGWMEACEGSCFGMAGASRLFQEGTLPVGTFDVADGDGVHGVRFTSGYLRPTSPARWTGFDLYEAFRAKNLWARIQSLSGAQTSSEGLLAWLSQLQPPVESGPRRGWAAGNPVEVLNRVRSAPGNHTISVQKRDFGDGHAMTPYGVVDGHGLDAAALNPIPAPDFSLIKVYDNNWPGQERFVEVDRVNNTYRYNPGSAEIYEGPGLFYTPMSVYRGPRHAPNPAFLAQYGTEYLRLLAVGASSASVTDGGGGRAGWSPTGMSSTYRGALPYVPLGLVNGGTERFDTAMLFLPSSNAPVSVGFISGGSDVMVYAGMGWGDIAFGFHAPDTTVSNSVNDILLDEDNGLLGLGLRLGTAVTGFSAMTATRDGDGQSRVWILDAGPGTVLPDVHLERDGFRSLRIRNRSAQPIRFRVSLAGVDPRVGGYEYHYESEEQPGNTTLLLRAPDRAGTSDLIRELDTDNDGTPDTITPAPARGNLRISREAGLLALRWRQAAGNETLQTTSDLTGDWVPAGLAITTEGADRVARAMPGEETRMFRVVPAGSNCFSIAEQSSGTRANPWTAGGFHFEAMDGDGRMPAENSIVNRNGSPGLDVQHTIRIRPEDDYQVIHVDVHQTSGLVSFEAVGALGTVLARQELTGPEAGVQRVTLSSYRDRIHFVRVTSVGALCVVTGVCGERLDQTQASPE